MGVAVGDGAGMEIWKSIGVGEMVGISVDVAAGVVAEGVGVGETGGVAVGWVLTVPAGVDSGE